MQPLIAITEQKDNFNEEVLAFENANFNLDETARNIKITPLFCQLI